MFTTRVAKRVKVMFSQASVCPTRRGGEVGDQGPGHNTSLPPGTRSQHLPPPLGPGHNTSLPPGPGHNTSLSPPSGTRSQHLPPPPGTRPQHHPLPPPLGPGHNTSIPPPRGQVTTHPLSSPLLGQGHNTSLPLPGTRSQHLSPLPDQVTTPPPPGTRSQHLHPPSPLRRPGHNTFPPPRTMCMWAVCILLEGILVLQMSVRPGECIPACILAGVYPSMHLGKGCTSPTHTHPVHTSFSHKPPFTHTPLSHTPFHTNPIPTMAHYQRPSPPGVTHPTAMHTCFGREFGISRVFPKLPTYPEIDDSSFRYSLLTFKQQLALKCEHVVAFLLFSYKRLCTVALGIRNRELPFLPTTFFPFCFL